MLNTGEFAIRIKKIMEYYDLSASSFAEKINVPRSSISHIISGRNKPSLDFILKVTKEFEEVDLYWLLKNKGNFPKTNSPIQPTNQKNLFSQTKKENTPEDTEKEFTPNSTTPHALATTDSSIKKVMIFYTDGTFEEFTNRNQNLK